MNENDPKPDDAPVFTLPTDGSLGDPLLPATREALGLNKPLACPTCGTAQPENVCAGCGHQWAAT